MYVKRIAVGLLDANPQFKYQLIHPDKNEIRKNKILVSTIPLRVIKIAMKSFFFKKSNILTLRLDFKTVVILIKLLTFKYVM